MTKGFILLLLHPGSLWAPPTHISDEFLGWRLRGHQSTPHVCLAVMEPSITCRWTHAHTFSCPRLCADTHRPTMYTQLHPYKTRKKPFKANAAEVSGKKGRIYHEQAKKWWRRRQDAMNWRFHPEGRPAARGEGGSSHLGERSALCLFLSLGTAFTIVLGNKCQSKHQQIHSHLFFSPLKNKPTHPGSN